MSFGFAGKALRPVFIVSATCCLSTILAILSPSSVWILFSTSSLGRSPVSSNSARQGALEELKAQQLQPNQFVPAGLPALAHNLSSATQQRLVRLYKEHLSVLLGRQLLTWATPKADRKLCSALPQPAAQVALVGNGPISDEQRDYISKAHCIVRFNLLNSRTSERDRTDLWFVRGRGGNVDADPPFFIPYTDVPAQAVNEARAIILADSYSAPVEAPKLANSLGQTGSKGLQVVVQRAAEARPSNGAVRATWRRAASKVADLLTLGPARHPAAVRAKLLPLELGPLYFAWIAFTSELGYTDTLVLPSTGLVGVLAVLRCLPLGGSLHIYGFNWNPENWEGHQMQVESGLIHLLSAELGGRVIVHTTPCSSYRACS